jgi:LPXTG-motif cell wall-anchored protein/uncharacterized repeat protein (TIGR01451 family)
MKKLLTMAFGAVMASVVGLSNAYATYDFGQIGSGGIYSVRNVSKNSDFAKTVNADLCETVQFKVRIHNAGPQTVTNVKVKATLDQSEVSTVHASTVSVTADNNRNDAVATGSASVNLSKAGKISYVAGSTELLDANGGKMQTLPDTLLTSGVNIGSVAVSLNNMRFVQFEAKFNCETPPQPGEITVCRLSDNQIVNIKETDFDSAKYTKDLSKCAEVTPPELPHTGSTGNAIAVVASLLTAAAGYAVVYRKKILG